jgi:SOS response regulatory protein OraA/RecX
VDEIYHQALKLLRRRDYTVAQLRERLASRFGDVPDETIEKLVQKRFLDDTRFASNFVSKRSDRHPSLVREELLRAGISSEIIEQSLASNHWPSLQDVLRAKMVDWNFQAPIRRREASRLFRALAGLGYPEDEIREELDQLHEQQ